MRSEFQAAIAQLIAEKGLPREVVMESVNNALLSAYRKSFGGGENIRIEVDKNGDVRVWAEKRVVAQVNDANSEISLAEAQRVDPHAALRGQTAADKAKISDTPLAGDAPNSLADAQQALATIAGYYSRSEPSSPILPLVRQAHQLIGKSFFEVMSILVPTQMDKAAFQIGADQFFGHPGPQLNGALQMFTFHDLLHR